MRKAQCLLRRHGARCFTQAAERGAAWWRVVSAHLCYALCHEPKDSVCFIVIWDAICRVTMRAGDGACYFWCRFFLDFFFTMRAALQRAVRWRAQRFMPARWYKRRDVMPAIRWRAWYMRALLRLPGVDVLVMRVSMLILPLSFFTLIISR